MTNTVVYLEPGEVMTAATIAAMRQSVNRQAGTVNLKAGKQDVMTTELVGTFGELAFAKWAGVMPDLTTHLRRGSADAIFRGYTVDVKSSRNPLGDLWVDARPDKRADLYVLVHVEYCRCEILGWVWSGEVLERAHQVTETNARVPAASLDHPEWLWDIDDKP